MSKKKKSTSSENKKKVTVVNESLMMSSSPFARIIRYIKEGYKKLLEKPALFMFVIAAVLAFLMEILARRSLVRAVLFVFTNPVGFLVGVAIICATLLPALFLSFKYSYMGLIMTLWIAMSVTDFIVRCFRMTPFSAMDISLINSVFSIIYVYLNVWGILLICALGLFAIFLIGWMFFKLPHKKVSFKLSMMSSCRLLIVIGLIAFSASQSGAVTGSFANLAKAYDSYGFTYCFAASVFSRGIARPSGYSQEAVAEIDQRISGLEKPHYSDVENPNIILVQLESYMDVNDFLGVKYSENPVPTFTELKKTCPYGLLTVPSIGAGTANTEFEVLTGMNKEYFGIGEYPYKTILQNRCCESICYNLKSSGYATHAIHNHYGAFYDRNKVFANLGFDTFTPVEHMTYVPTTMIDWEKDEILPTYVDAAMKSTDGRDFIFTITVQCHGKYPIAPTEQFTPRITITDGIDNEEQLYTMEYYVNMMYETDAMMANLIKMYENYKEPVMIVFYGDHLPNITMTEDDISSGSLLDTEYAIWTNYDLPIKERKRDLTAYQLTAYIMELCNKSDGVLTKLHQSYNNEENGADYQHMLNLIQYDMLYGDSYINSKKYEPTNIKLGINDIKITDVDYQKDEESQQNVIVVKGTGFTAWSVVYVNDAPVRTVFKNTQSLITDIVELKPGDVITVSQVNINKQVLSTTKPYVIKGGGKEQHD